jgi:beta-glucosidase
MSLDSKNFGRDFKWGVSSAAYQTEGGWDLDGKGKSVWDVFANKKGKIFNNENGNTACDFYHRYAEDIEIIQQLKIPNFRFSLSWSRILPNGIGSVSREGVDFYNRVINLCLERGIEPWITLYHWDLPYELEKKGGWTNREILTWFSEYVEVCIKCFGDRVKHWMVLNEPLVFTGVGYFLGLHAPGRKGLTNFLAAAHHAAMCQSLGGRIIRSMLPEAKVGTTFSCSLVHPLRPSDRDESATKRIDALLNRMFVEPLAGLGYPVKDLKFLQRLEQFVKDGDETQLPFKMDFIGVQNYTREIVTSSLYMPLVRAKLVKANNRNVDITEMNWEVYPESIYEMLIKFSKYLNFKEIIVTENGAAFHDSIINGGVNDEKRRLYLEMHIDQVLRAKRNGVNVNGYFVWCLTDNFEWAEGYRPRFGLVHVDFNTQQRIIKNSGYWYGRVIQSQILENSIF